MAQLALALALTGSAGAAAAQPPFPHAWSPVTEQMLSHPADGDWLMWRRTYQGWGYSPLNQIDSSSVARLRLVWARALDTPGTQEGTPLVHDGVLFMPEPNHVISAIDAVSGDLLWRYKRELPADIGNFVSLTDTHRNVAISGDLIFESTADDFIVAIDARTGKLVWETKVADYHNNPASQTSGPMVFEGKVVSGRSCEPRGGPDACVIVAHDAITGKELWRTHTIPRVGEAGDASWNGMPWEGRWHVGSWMPASFDPDLRLIYLGTSVTSPAPKFLLRGNDNKYLYHNSTLAIDPASGKIVWHYQHLVDHWDMDHVFERLLVTTPVAPLRSAVPWINPKIRPGEKRSVVTGIPGKTGIVYTLDARTGQFLWARPTVQQNLVKSIDAKGAVTVNRDMLFHKKGDERVICPSRDGGRNWPAGAFSPLTGTMYMPVQNSCARITVIIDKPTLTSRYGHRYTSLLAPGKSKLGSIYAISAETGATNWVHEEDAATLALMATGGGLLFGGDANGRFRAMDQATGKTLWEVNLGSPATGFPISFAVDGRQYIAVSTGSYSLLGALNPHIGAANMLYVFALPQ